jgi:hypothetical protein
LAGQICQSAFCDICICPLAAQSALAALGHGSLRRSDFGKAVAYLLSLEGADRAA